MAFTIPIDDAGTMRRKAYQATAVVRIKKDKYAEYQDMTVVSEFPDEGFSGKNIKWNLRFRCNDCSAILALMSFEIFLDVDRVLNTRTTQD